MGDDVAADTMEPDAGRFAGLAGIVVRGARCPGPVAVRAVAPAGASCGRASDVPGGRAAALVDEAGRSSAEDRLGDVPADGDEGGLMFMLCVSGRTFPGKCAAVAVAAQARLRSQ
jgi:hypothetical protein